MIGASSSHCSHLPWSLLIHFKSSSSHSLCCWRLNPLIGKPFEWEPNTHEYLAPQLQDLTRSHMIESKSQYVRTRRNLKGELRNTYERVVYKHSGFEKLALQLLPSSSSKPLVQTKWDCFMNPLPLFMRSKAIYSVSVRLHIIVSNQCFFGLHLFS